MAGQPPEPSLQPTQQDQGLTQGRPAWPPSTYTPPGGSGQPGYAAPSYSASGQDQAQAQGYPPQDQTYTSLGQGQGQGQGQYQGYQPPSYAQPGQGAAMPPPQWQAAPPAPAKTRQRTAGEKGFLGSLFDFSFTSLVTPKIIKVLYVLFTIWTALIGLIILDHRLQDRRRGGRPVHPDHRRADLRAADARHLPGGARGVRGGVPDL